MKKNNLNEELLRIREIMSLNVNLILEINLPTSAKNKVLSLLKSLMSSTNIGDEFQKIFKSWDNDVATIIAKIKNARSLTPSELELLINKIDWEKFGSKLVKYGVGVPNFNLDNVAKAFGKNTPEETKAAYEDWIRGVEKVALEKGFGRFPGGVPDEIKPMYEMIIREIKEKVDQHLLDKYPKIHQQIFPAKAYKKTFVNLLNEFTPQSWQLLYGAYRNYFSKQKEIQKKLELELYNLLQDYTKNVSSGGGTQVEPYARRITQTAFGLQKWNDDASQVLQQKIEQILPPSLQRLVDNTEAMKYFEEAVVETIRKKPDNNVAKDLLKIFQAYAKLVNPYRYFKTVQESTISKLLGGVSSPSENRERLFNFVLQLQPYTSRENVERIARMGVWKVTAARFGGQAIAMSLVAPVILGIYEIIFGTSKELWESVKPVFGGTSDPAWSPPVPGEDESITQDREENEKWGTHKTYFKRGEVSPGKLSEYTLVDDVFEAAKAIWDYFDQTGAIEMTPEQQEAAAAGLRLLKGEEMNLSGANYALALNDVKKVIIKQYPNIENHSDILNSILLNGKGIPYITGKQPLEDGRVVPASYKLFINAGEEKIYYMSEEGPQEINTLWIETE